MAVGASAIHKKTVLTIADNSSLLLAAYDVSGRLHLYRIETKWSAPPPPVKQGQPLKPFEKPELIASEICTEDICYPINTVGNGNLDDTATFQIRIPAQLTHLNFLPKTPESDDGSLPTIQAIFSTPPATPSFDHAQPHQDPYSILVRWEVHRTQKNQLHPSLDQVTSKKKSVGSIPARDELSLKRLDDTVLRHDTVILAFHPYWYNMILAYCYSDGSIEFRKRATMEVLGPDFNTETLTSIFQTGFAFPQHEPSLHVALSPNYCIAAGMQQDGTIKLRPIEYTYGSLSVDDGDPKHSAALASLVLQCASGTNQYSSTDDIFAIMGELSEKKKDEFLTTMFQGLHVTLDCTGEEALTGNSLLLLGRSPFFVRTLSAAHLLGLQGTLKRSISSKVAWMVLNIKSMTQFITTIMRMHNPIETSIVRPEMVPQSLGFIRWMVSFMVYVVDELFTVGRELQKLAPNPLNRATIEETITTLNKPAILVLLSSFARIMMKTWPNFLTWVQKTASRIGPRQVNNLEMIKLYAPLQQVLYEMPFRWSQFESLLTDTHNLVRRTYHRANLSETQRNLAERELLLGRCPDVLIPVAKHLLTDALFGEQSASSSDATNKDAKPGLADKINVASVHFFDTTWLGLTDSRAARAWHATHVVDVVQKMILRGKGAQKHPPPSRILGATRLGFKNMNPALDVEERVRTGRDRLRKCTRCASYMDDVRVGVSGYLANHAQMIMGAGRHCVCGNSWGLVEGPFV